MKKIISVLLISSLILQFTSCNVPGKPEDETNDETTVSESESLTSEDNEEDTDPQPSKWVDVMSYESWLDNTYTYLKNISIDKDAETSLITDDSSDLAWHTYYYLCGFYRGYCATGDIAFLEQYAIYIYRIYQLMADNDGDGYLSWGKVYIEGDKNYGYNEYAVHVGMIVSAAGNFVGLVYGDKEIASMQSPFGITYKEIADFLIDRSVNHAIPSFDCDWRDDLGVYMNRPGSYNYGGAEEEISLPHNQYLCMAMAMISFAKFSPEHREEYIRKSEMMFETFRNTIKFNYDKRTAEWVYKDAMFEGDRTSSTEDYSHGLLDVSAAIVGYENGLAFTLEDINAITGTFEIVMYRPTVDGPRLSYYTNGGGDSTGAIHTSGFDMSVYGAKLINERGMRYRLSEQAQTCFDAAWALAFHKGTPAPKDFSLTLPSNGEESIDPDCAVFAWQRTPYANYYKLQISSDAEFNNIIVDRDKIIDSSVIVTSLPENTELYYRVIACNMKGDENVSETYSFKTSD